MNKPVLGLLIGGFLGIFDGLSALLSAPETRPEIVGIVIGSTFKGLVVGVLAGWFARRAHAVAAAALAAGDQRCGGTSRWRPLAGEQQEEQRTETVHVGAGIDGRR